MHRPTFSGKQLMRIIISCLSVLALSACTSANYHAKQIHNDCNDKITLGAVQKSLAIGMSSADVISKLGAPNIVSTDEHRCEQWIYDKIATDTKYSASNGGIGALLFGFTSYLFGGPLVSYEQGAGAKSVNQRTLTIVVKFDADSKVRDFAYHNSSF